MTNGALAIRFEMVKVFNPSFLILLWQLRRLRIQRIYQLWKCTKLKLGDCVQREQIFKTSDRSPERFTGPTAATTSLAYLERPRKDFSSCQSPRGTPKREDEDDSISPGTRGVCPSRYLT